MRRLAVLHLAGNAVLLLLGYYWLGVGEATAASLAWSAFVALVLICGAVWLHGAALALFRGAPGSAPRTALRNLAPLLAVALATLGLYFALAWWRDYSPQPALKLASWLTLHLRRPVTPAGVLRVFNTALWLVRWVVIPVLALPLAAEVAAKGWSGFGGESWKRSRRWVFWIQTPVLLLCALWVPLKLILWVPPASAFSMQMASFLARLAVAYLLFVAGWLTLEFFSSRGPVSSS